MRPDCTATSEHAVAPDTRGQGSRPASRTVAFATIVLPVMAQQAKPDPRGSPPAIARAWWTRAARRSSSPNPTDKSAPDLRRRRRKPTTSSRPQAEQGAAGRETGRHRRHVRIGDQLRWTLNTGYLVLFMQAGFALLTCGLVRKKNAAHLMMLNFAAYVFAFLAYYAVGYAFQFGAVAINAAPANLGGTPTLNHFLLGSGAWGFLGGKGFFLTGPAYDAGANCLMLFEVVFMETAGYIIVGAICERITFWRVPALRTLRRRDPVSGLRLLGLGRRLDVAARHDDGPRPRLCRFRRLHRRPRGRRILRDGAGRSFSVRASASTDRTASRAPFPRTTSCSS